MSDEPRRLVLGEFRDGGDDVVDVQTLVDSLAGAATLPDDPERVALRLHHVTLPQLAEAGVIEYDGRSNTARLSESSHSERLFELLSAVDSLG